MIAPGPDILVVEDELPIAELLVYTLAANGWNVRTCATAAEGWKALQQATPQLVLLDWM